MKNKDRDALMKDVREGTVLVPIIFNMNEASQLKRILIDRATNHPHFTDVQEAIHLFDKVQAHVILACENENERITKSVEGLQVSFIPSDEGSEDE